MNQQSTIATVAHTARRHTRNLGTYSNSTYNQESIDLLLNSFHKNYIDKNAHPDVVAIEQDTLNFLLRNMHASDGVGVATTGSSEAIILAMAWHRKSFAAKRKSTEPLNFVIHIGYHKAFEKFASLFDVELRAIPLDSNYRIDAKAVAARVDESTFCVVGIAGSTEMGMVDNITDLEPIAQKYKIPIHIDAAAGGYVLPFLPEQQATSWDFALPSVQTINVSAHKYGLCVPGIGFLLARNSSIIPSDYDGRMDYLAGGSTTDHALTCTRNAAFVTHAHHNMLLYGAKGYAQLAAQNYQRAKELIKALQKIPQISKTINGDLPVVTFTGERIEKLSAHLRSQGWVQSAHQISSLREKYIRVVLRKDVTSGKLQEFIADIVSFYKQKEKNYS